MILETLPVGPLQCNCSIVGDESSREALVVDPGGDVPRILALLARHQLTLKTIALTHAHLDHVGGAMELRQATGARLLLCPADQPLLDMLSTQAQWLSMRDPGDVQIDAPLTPGETLRVGSLEAQILATPGHTEGSVCLYFAAQKLLIAGDLLFAGSIGRTDLPGGSSEKIIRSLREVIQPLPDEVHVVTGHGPNTTLADEKAENPYLGAPAPPWL